MKSLLKNKKFLYAMIGIVTVIVVIIVCVIIQVLSTPTIEAEPEEFPLTVSKTGTPSIQTQKQQKISEYENILNTTLAEQTCDVSVSYKDLNSTASYNYNPEQSYYGASLIKTVAALYVYENMSPVTTQNKNLVQRAITYSDNNAYMQLVNIIGVSKLKAYGEEMGLNNFMNNKISTAYTDTTVLDQVTVFQKLWDFVQTNPSGEELQSYFVNTISNDLIFDPEINVMHKYGQWGQSHHDAGIVLVDKPYIVVVLTDKCQNPSNVINDVSQKVFDLHRAYQE